MIHIHPCVVWRNNKWVVTSSDTVTGEERLAAANKMVNLAFKECRKTMFENYWNDSEILKYLNSPLNYSREK